MTLEREREDREREKGGKRKRGCVFSASLPTLKKKTEKNNNPEKGEKKKV